MSPEESHGMRSVELANRALEAGRALMNQVLARLHDRASRNGRVSASAVDAMQAVGYEVAVSASELVAAQCVLDYADEARRSEAPSADAPMLEERLAAVFACDAVQKLRSRVAATPEDYGVSASDVEALVGREEIRTFCACQLSAGNLSELGGLLCADGTGTGVNLLNEEQRKVQDRFRAFADEVVSPLADRIHRENLLVPDEILLPLKEMGCFGISIPRSYGGQLEEGREDTLSMILVTEELSRASLGGAGSLITRTEILGRAIAAGGTAEQKSKWLPSLAAGDVMCAVAVTEPDYGSDVASMKLRASRTDNGWVLNGRKTWSTFSGKAGLLLVLARTDPDESLGHKGLSLLLVEKPSVDGLEYDYTQPEGGRIFGKAIPAIGYRGMHSFWIVFQNYFVPEENLIGGEAGLGRGFYYLMGGFSGGRIQTAARAVGVMQAAYDQALAFANRRKVFGKPIAEYQLTQVKIARMAMLLAASRQFTYAVGRLMDAGKGQVEANMVKLFTCKVSEWLTREAMQIHGSKGYAEGIPVSRHFVDARVLSIFEGAEEVLAIKVIARALIERGALV